MKLLGIIFFLCIGTCILIYIGHRQPPLQGMLLLDGKQVLASRAHPSVILIPEDMQLVRSGWKTVRPKDRRLESETVRVSLAEYRSGDAQMICALAETPGEFEWEAPGQMPYRPLRVHDEPYGKERLYESIYLLAPGQDPFSTGEHVLVMRAKFLLFFRKMQVLLEYREPLDAERARTIDLDTPAVKAFLSRAEHAYRVQFPGTDEKSVFDGIERLEPFGRIERDTLSTWLGEVKHPGHGR